MTVKKMWLMASIISQPRDVDVSILVGAITESLSCFHLLSTLLDVVHLCQHVLHIHHCDVYFHTYNVMFKWTNETLA